MLEVMLLFGAGVLGGMMNAIAGGGRFYYFSGLDCRRCPSDKCQCHQYLCLLRRLYQWRAGLSA